MKEKLITFLIVFATCFTLFYLTQDRDFGRFVFISSLVAVFSALTEKHVVRFIVNSVKKIVKPQK